MHAHPIKNAIHPTLKRGIVFAKYGDLAASTRQRFVQAIPYIEQAGISLTIAPLFDNQYLEALFRQGTRNRRRILTAYIRRLFSLLECRHYDFIVVQYELFPYLPPVFESLLRLTTKPVFYDMDDAIFHQYDAHRNPMIRRLLGKKLAPLLRRADVAFCGNAYLQAYAERYCHKTMIIPTTLDVSVYQPLNPTPQRLQPTLGWIGSPSTWNYCAPFTDMIASLVRKDGLTFRVIGAGPNANTALPFTFTDWIESREVADIQSMDIGIMPIPDEPWARGKCGYKLIQYMACGIPVIASPVGVNREIVRHGINGYLATTEEEWHEAIIQLMGDSELRARMGRAGRAHVEEHYSIQRYGPEIAQRIISHLT